MTPDQVAALDQHRQLYSDFISNVWAIVVALFGALLSAKVAGSKGRDSFSWFVVALVCTPILAVVALLALPVRERSTAKRGFFRDERADEREAAQGEPQH